MTNRELAAVLRLCGDTRTVEECRAECPFYKGPDVERCVPKMTSACADALENHESHVLALQKEIEKLRGQLEFSRGEREALLLRLKATPLLECGIPYQVRDGVLDLVSKHPAADVAPVRRGEWEQFHSGPDDYALRLRCSHCRKAVYERGFHFCPGCGADMRGADNGTN